MLMRYTFVYLYLIYLHCLRSKIYRSPDICPYLNNVLVGSSVN